MVHRASVEHRTVQRIELAAHGHRQRVVVVGLCHVTLDPRVVLHTHECFGDGVVGHVEDLGEVSARVLEEDLRLFRVAQQLHS